MSKARDLARLSPNTSGQIPQANLQDDIKKQEWVYARGDNTGSYSISAANTPMSYTVGTDGYGFTISNTNSRFTATRAGKYLIVCMNNRFGNYGGVIATFVRKNGNIISGQIHGSTNSEWSTSGTSLITTLGIGDYIENVTDRSATMYPYDCTISIIRIGDA